MPDYLIPWFGYLASLFLILALSTNRDLKFRWFTLCGNVSFIVYAILLPSIPVLITNTILLGINIYYLRKLYRKQESFDIIEFSGNEALAHKFLEFHEKEIAHYFPDFRKEQLHNSLNFVVLRDLVIANMFSAKVSAEGDAVVQINFTVARYRDFKVGQYIFNKEKDFLTARNIRRIVYTDVKHRGHMDYLKAMGFVHQPSHPDRWVKEIA